MFLIIFFCVNQSGIIILSIHNVKIFLIYIKYIPHKTKNCFYIPNKACKLALHCVNLSPGSDCGKNTDAGNPFEAGSKRKPTDINSSFHPLTGPTLFSILF